MFVALTRRPAAGGGLARSRPDRDKAGHSPVSAGLFQFGKQFKHAIYTNKMLEALHAYTTKAVSVLLS